MAAKHNFTDDQVADYRDQFAEVDEDKSGRISSAELKSIMSKSGIDMTDAQVSAMIKDNAKAGSSELDFDDFLGLMWRMQSGPSEKDIRNEIFTILDDNMDGLVTIEELRAFVKRASAESGGILSVPSDDVLKAMLAEGAANGSAMTFEDLCSVLDQLAE